MVMQDGMVIGPYRIAGILGKGGMATVYRGYHERLDRYVAVKVMHPTFLSDDNFRTRFQREARIVARLEHPNIVQVYDYNEHENLPYLVMKYVEGMTLKKYALKKGVTLTQTSSMLTELAGAMDYAHEKGILHRDMKPSNIIIESETGRPYITDFGLARIAQVGASTLSHDMMLGTPYYISPEQAQGLGDLDKRTDIYSFAVILYELITGSVPFMADTPYAIVHGHIYKEPQPPGERNDDLPVAVDDVLLKALSKAPEDRYNSATELMQAFNAALLGAGVPDESLSQPIETMSVPIHVEKLPSTQPPVRRDKQGKKVAIESSFDMGNVDWSDLGRRFETGVKNFASMIEERIDDELESRGAVLETPDSPEAQEERIRQRVKKRLKARGELGQHVAMFFIINLMLFGIWFFTGSGFPWPFMVFFSWGVGVFAHGMEYYNEYGAGARRVEETYRRELEDEMRRSGMRDDKGKNKDKRRYDEDVPARLTDTPATSVRLNEDGELTDSFVEEQQRRGSY